jgi:hypothetical protein
MTAGDFTGLENLIVADFVLIFFILRFLGVFGQSIFAND